MEIETDKAIMDYEAYESGVLQDILVPEGEHASIGSVIARIDDGVPAAEPLPSEPDAEHGSSDESSDKTSSDPSARADPASTRRSGERVLATHSFGDLHARTPSNSTASRERAPVAGSSAQTSRTLCRILAAILTHPRLRRRRRFPNRPLSRAPTYARRRQCRSTRRARSSAAG